MLDDKSLIVLAYLKNHFKSSNKPLAAPEIIISGISVFDIVEAFNTLEANEKVELDRHYFHPLVVNVID